MIQSEAEYQSALARVDILLSQRKLSQVEINELTDLISQIELYESEGF